MQVQCESIQQRWPSLHHTYHANRRRLSKLFSEIAAAAGHHVHPFMTPLACYIGTVLSCLQNIDSRLDRKASICASYRSGDSHHPLLKTVLR